MKSTPAQLEGAVEFLKWFTESERNINFALMSSYSPVTLAANTQEAISAGYSGDITTEKGKNVLNALIISSKSFSNNTAYATKPFNGSKEVRQILGDALENTAKTDRAAVVSAINNGASREDALSAYLTDEYFDIWFAHLCEQVNTAIEKQ